MKSLENKKESKLIKTKRNTDFIGEKKTVLADKQYLAIYNYWLKNEYPDKILRFFKVKNEKKAEKRISEVL